MRNLFQKKAGSGNDEPKAKGYDFYVRLEGLVARYEQGMRGRGHMDLPSLVTSTIKAICADNCMPVPGTQGVQDFELLGELVREFPEYKGEFAFGVREGLKDIIVVHNLINTTDQGGALARMYGAVKDDPVVAKYMRDMVEAQYARLIWDTIICTARESKFEALGHTDLKDAALKSIARGGASSSQNWISGFGVNPAANVPQGQLIAATESNNDRCFSNAPRLAAATKSGLQAMVTREDPNYRRQERFTL